MAKTNRIKKSNHRTFAIVFSTLIIIALAIMVPLSLSSLNTSTEPRSQAAGNTALDQQERASDKKFVINSRYNPNEYIYFFGTYIPEIKNNLPLGQYTLDIQYKATEMEGRGFQIALVCDADTCPSLDPNSEDVKKGEALYYVNPSTFGIGVHRNKYSFSIPRNTPNTKLQINANSGTNIEIDFVKLWHINGTTSRQLLANPSFTERISTTYSLNQNQTSETHLRMDGNRNNRPYTYIISDYLNMGRVFMFNGHGKPYGSGQRNTDIMRTNRTRQLQANREYTFTMKYFVPPQRIQYDDNMFSISKDGFESGTYFKSRLNTSATNCNLDTGAGCQLQELRKSFVTTEAYNGNIHLLADPRLELYIQSVELTDNQGSVVIRDNFSNYQTISREFAVPANWTPAAQWQQIYGTSSDQSDI